MEVVEFDGQDVRSGLAATSPPASPKPGSGSPKKAFSVKFTSSPAGFAGTNSASSGPVLRHRSFEHADSKSVLGEELSRRLDKIDNKLDWLVTRAKVTSTADTRHDRNAASSQSSCATTDADKTATLRSTADGGHLISIEPPSPVVNTPVPAGYGPHVMVHRRSSSLDSADRALAADRADRALTVQTERGGVQNRLSKLSKAGSEERNLDHLQTGSPGPTPRVSRASSNRGSTLIPNLSRRDTLTRTNTGMTRSTAWTASGRSLSGRSSGSAVPDAFKNQFVARRMYEKSQNKDLEWVQKYMNSLPTAMTKQRSKSVQQIYEVLDDPGSSNVAWWTAKCLEALVLLSVLGTFLQTVENPLLHGRSAAIVETVFDTVFLAEICIRWCTAPNKVNFMLIFHNWIDIAAASALAVRAANGFVLPESQDDSVSIFLLCFVPIIRLLKILRHFETFNVLIQAVNITMEALPMLLYAVALITMIFATLIYLVEPELFESPFRAVWFCLVTVTTVGYGDYTPVTTAGIAVVMVLIVLGVILMAVPIGIIGSAFNEVWNTRDYSLLMSKTRMKLHQWGYTANDIPTLFKLVDYDDNGVLELDEFCELVKEMHIGLSEDRVIALFGHMDKDGSGALDASEFALAVFPHKYVENFGHAGTISKHALTKLRESTFSALTQFTVRGSPARSAEVLRD